MAIAELTGKEVFERATRDVVNCKLIAEEKLSAIMGTRTGGEG